MGDRARYIIWDFDGTLGYREGGMWSQTLADLASQARPGRPVTAEQVRPYLLDGFPWHRPDRPHPHLCDGDAWWRSIQPTLIGALVGVGIDAAEAAALAVRFRPIYVNPAAFRLYDDALPALRALSAAGWGHLLLTNHVPELDAILAHLELDRHMQRVFNSAQTGYEKPHPQAFRGVLDAIGPCERVWMVGDSPAVDVAGAEAVGIPGILVRRVDPSAKRQCGDLEAVVELIMGAQARRADE